jgi:hypothetical protein
MRTCNSACSISLPSCFCCLLAAALHRSLPVTLMQACRSSKLSASSEGRIASLPVEIWARLFRLLLSVLHPVRTVQRLFINGPMMEQSFTFGSATRTGSCDPWVRRCFRISGESATGIRQVSATRRRQRGRRRKRGRESLIHLAAFAHEGMSFRDSACGAFLILFDGHHDPPHLPQ